MKSTIAYILIAYILGTCAASIIYQYDEGDLTMLEQMDLALEIPYVKKGGSLGSVKMNVGNATVVQDGSSLNSTYAVLQLSFGELDIHNLTQTFKSDGKQFWMEEMTFFIFHDAKVFKDAKDTGSASFTLPGEQFNTSIGYSYACDAPQTKTITQSKQKFNMTFTNMKLQPFGVQGATFSRGEHCPADPTTAGPSTTGKTTPATTKSKTTSKTTPATTPATTKSQTTSNSTTPGTTKSQTTSNTTATTTTTKPATTTAPPPVLPNKLNFTDGNHTCILEQIEANFTVENESFRISVEMTDAKVIPSQSQCGNKDKGTPAVLVAGFGDLGASTLRQEFAINKEQKYYYLNKMTLSLIGEGGQKGPQNITIELVMGNNDTLHVPFGNSLKCNSNTTIDSKTKKYNVTTYFANIRLQAFDIKNNTYSSAYECPADHAISNIVPIAVGCALAVLVIIVLVAYLIGRRNSSRAGYESV